MSRTYFSYAFHMSTGMKVWDYITDKRVKLAMQWLAESDYAVTEVAMRSGFNHMASFYRAFRARVGQSPSEYRKAAVTIFEEA